MTTRLHAMTRVPALLAAAVAIAALLPSSGSRAYTPLVSRTGVTLKWDLRTFAANVQNDLVSFHTHPAGTKDDLKSSVNEFEAVRRSFAAWEGVETSRMRFWEDSLRTAHHHNVQDRVNLIQFVEEELDPFVLGVTYPYEENGRLVDCDIILNDDYDWSTSTPGRAGKPDIQSVVTHEAGHFLGLDHTPLGASTMFYAYGLGGISTRSLEEDDHAGLTLLYPTEDVDSRYGRLVGRVEVEGATNHRGIHVVAIDVTTAEPFSSTLTSPDGTYEILVRPGFYRIVATPTRPLSSLNSYWSSSDDRIVPRAITQEGTAVGLARIFRASALEEVELPALTVTRESSPLEPDNEPDQATVIQIGDMAAARFDAHKEDDWFAFDGRAGDVLTYTVHAQRIGSGGDPELALFDSDGKTELARSVDIRSQLFPENEFGPDGIDHDCRIDEYVLKHDGRHYLRVRSSAYGNVGSKGDYYVLGISSGKDAPSRLTTSVDVTPTRLPADGASTSVIRITPRNVVGDILGTGLIVTIEHDGVGTLSAVSDHGNGKYSAVLIAASAPGEDRIDVVIRGGGGSADLLDVERIVYVGPADPERTEIRADPGRIPADGSATSTITVVPRDARGEPVLGQVDVDLSFVGEPLGQLGTVLAHGDSRYTGALVAPSEEGEAWIVASIDGGAPTGAVRVTYGFALSSVIRDAAIEAEELSRDENLSSSVRKRFAKALAKFRSADGRLHDPRTLVPDDDRALKDIYKALKQVAKARAKAGDPGLFSMAEDVLESVRRVVDDETSPGGEARALYDSARFLASLGDLRGAARGYQKAYRQGTKERNPAHVRAAEVVLERDATGTRIVSRIVSGKLREANLSGPLEAELESAGKVDGSRVYEASLSGATEGSYELIIEPRAAAASLQVVPFTVDGPAPGLPTIQAPADDATGVSRTPTVRWTGVAGADRYGIVITDRDGAIAFADSVPRGTTSVTVPVALALVPGVRYTVEVRAVAEDGDRAISRSKFRTGS